VRNQSRLLVGLVTSPQDGWEHGTNKRQSVTNRIRRWRVRRLHEHPPLYPSGPSHLAGAMHQKPL